MTAYQELVHGTPRHWSGRREVGVIAGSTRVGLGRLFSGNLDVDSDGTVMVSETLLPGAKDHIVLRASHTSMLFSTEVAAQTAHFLKQGAFNRS